ncbi:MAG TPA: hypothetical protein VGX03_31815 [Candidatus Binatia bacterium]|nr:hypothetical protein [Candidatus Binatia bacterium]
MLSRKLLFTPVLTGLEGREETVLTLRVGDLSSFRTPRLPMIVRLRAWYDRLGTWVVVIAFHVSVDPQEPLAGIASLNPRQTADYGLLMQLTKQGLFPLIFLSADLSDAVGHQVPWSSARRREVAQLVMTIDQALTSPRLDGRVDLAFERARREFQSLYPLEKLLYG